MTRARCWRRSRRAEPARASHHRSPAAPRRRSCASCAPKSPRSLQSTRPTPLATRLCQGVPRAHRSRQVCQDRERTDAEYHWRGLSGERGTVREQRSFDARPHAARARHATLAVGASMPSARSGHERSSPPTAGNGEGNRSLGFGPPKTLSQTGKDVTGAAPETHVPAQFRGYCNSRATV